MGAAAAGDMESQTWLPTAKPVGARGGDKVRITSARLRSPAPVVVCKMWLGFLKYFRLADIFRYLKRLPHISLSHLVLYLFKMLICQFETVFLRLPLLCPFLLQDGVWIHLHFPSFAGAPRQAAHRWAKGHLGPPLAHPLHWWRQWGWWDPHARPQCTPRCVVARYSKVQLASPREIWLSIWLSICYTSITVGM